MNKIGMIGVNYVTFTQIQDNGNLFGQAQKVFKTRWILIYQLNLDLLKRYAPQWKGRQE